MTLDIDITVSCDDWIRALALSRTDTEALCRQAVQAAFDGVSGADGPAEVSLVLGDDALLQRLNHEYRGVDAPTNVLSFPGESAPPPDDGRPRVLGDVIVAYQTARAEAAAAGRPLGDHLRHLMVHGMLHLLGHDHQSDAEAEAMERLEVRVLAGLGVADPYAPVPVPRRPEKEAVES